MKHLTPHPLAWRQSYFGWTPYLKDQIGAAPVKGDGIIIICRLPCGCMEWAAILKDSPSLEPFYRVQPMDPT